MSILAKAQINENFTDGNFDRNPEWRGNTGNFKINEKLQLQSCATTTSVSSLFTNSESIVNAQWKAHIIINYSTSSSNYAAMYIISENENLTSGCNGYYVQIGGTNDEISLFLQQGTKKTKIIDGLDKRIADDSVNVEVKVTRDGNGNFELWSKKASENEYILEGKTQNNAVVNSYYFGLLYSNTSTTGKAYIFDNIEVTGEKAEDHINPTIKQLKITDENKIEFEFSERIDTSNLEIGINGQFYKTDSVELNGAKNILRIKPQYKFIKGIKYEITLSGISDYSGNYLINNTAYTGIPEDAEIGDLIWNEIMFNNPENSSEYVEIYNRSAKVIELTGMYISTRKNDGTLNSGNKIDYYLLMYPSEYIAFTSSPDSVLLYHNCPQDANVNKLNMSSLNNTSATIVLCSNNKEIIYDELKYNEKWHHTLIKNPKGVALEKINPDMETQNSDSWHSAGSTTNYGTPGYKNSQYKEIYP
ncbi:MAG: lamin tail domain-containing protein, partial [Paludibacter sp.]|nr:lamin tail domain-containing protein [Paludibacter sp.]